MAGSFDVFFSYHTVDHATVTQVARRLHERGIRVFLDRWYLAAGQPWPQALERTLRSCGAVAVFLGPEGLGPWQQRERDLALDRQGRERGFPVIPVLLSRKDPALGFLGLNTWVDLSEGITDETALETLIAAICRQPPGPLALQQIEAVRAEVCPYRGLFYFREEDEPFFFGRAAFTKTLAATIARQPFVAVVGASGSGKSSVVRAGLIPRLRRGEGGFVWDAITLVPSDRPLKKLAAALLPFLEPDLRPVDQEDDENKLAANFAKHDATRTRLRDITARVLAKQRGTDRLLLFVDQWEELYTLCPDERMRQIFIGQLLEAAAAGPIKVVLTMRGDFFGRALTDRALSDQMQDAVVNIGPMTRDELAETIIKPAEAVGLTFEAGLAETILDDVGEEPGSLPLLEFLLEALWKERRGALLHFDAYRRLGRVAGVIAHRADEVFAQLSEAERQAAQRLLMRMVRPGEGVEDTRQRAAMPAADPVVEATIRKLAKERLLVTERDAATGRETVEVAHEALIRGWQRLRGWVDQDREFLRTRERIAAEARLWESEGRPPDRLLPPGRPLAEGEDLLATRRADLDAELIAYIEASSYAETSRKEAARTQQRRQLMRARAIGLLMALLAAGGIMLSVMAMRNAERATQNLDYALDATGAVIKGMTDPFQNLVEVETSAVKLILDNTERIVSALETKLGSSLVGSQQTKLYAVKSSVKILDSDLYQRMGDSGKALENAIAAVDSLERLAYRDANDVQIRDVLSEGYNRVASLYLNRGDLYQALEYGRKTIAVLEQLLEDRPDDPNWNLYLSSNHDLLSSALTIMGNDESASAEDKKRTDYLKKAKVMAPNNAHWRSVLALDKLSTATKISQQGGTYSLWGARYILREALTDLESDIGAGIGRAQAVAVSADLHQQMATTLRNSEQSQEAAEHLRKAVALRRRSIEMDPDDVTRKLSLAGTLQELANLLMTQNEYSQAGDLLRESLTISEGLVAVDPENVVWQANLSQVHEAIGSISEAQGDLKAAVCSYREAFAAFRQAGPPASNNLGRQRLQYLAQQRIGNALERQDDLNGALVAHRDASAAIQRFGALASDDPGWQRDLARSEQRIGDVLKVLDDRVGALAAYGKSLAAMRRAVDHAPGNAGWQRELALSHQRIGEVLEAQGDGPGALAAYGDSLAAMQRAVEHAPKDDDLQDELALSHERLSRVLQAHGDQAGALHEISFIYQHKGKVSMAEGKLDDALAANREGVAALRRAVELAPDDAGWQRDLALANQRVGESLKAQHDQAGALAAFGEALASTQRASARAPDDPDWQGKLALDYGRIGKLLEAQDDRSGALQAYRNGRAAAERAVDHAPDDADWQRELAFSHQRIGKVLEAQGDLAGAIAAHRSSLAAIQRAATLAPEDPLAQCQVLTMSDRVGNLLKEQNILAEALAAYREGLTAIQRGAAAAPDQNKWQKKLVRRYEFIGMFLEDQGDNVGALAAHREGLGLVQRNVKRPRTEDIWESELISSYHRIGRVLENQGEKADALAAYQEAVAIAQRAVARSPDDDAWKHRLAFSYRRIGRFHEAQGDRPGALAAYQEGLAAMQRAEPPSPANTAGGLEGAEVLEAARNVCKVVTAVANGIAPTKEHVPAKALAVYREDLDALCAVVSVDRAKPSRREDVTRVAPSTRDQDRIKDVNGYFDLIIATATTEYRLFAADLIELDEVVGIAALALDYLFKKSNPDTKFEDAYLATAMRWAIRNELRQRYESEWACQ